SRVPSAAAVTQSAPPSTVPRKRSPSNDPPVIGKIESVPCVVSPISSTGAVVKRRRISGRAFMGPQLFETRLVQFMNGVDRTFSASVAGCHGYATVQECGRGVRGFEPRRRADIAGGRIAGPPAWQGLDRLLTAVTPTE